MNPTRSSNPNGHEKPMLNAVEEIEIAKYMNSTTDFSKNYWINGV
jgi:hypothetical protein